MDLKLNSIEVITRNYLDTLYDSLSSSLEQDLITTNEFEKRIIRKVMNDHALNVANDKDIIEAIKNATDYYLNNYNLEFEYIRDELHQCLLDLKVCNVIYDESLYLYSDPNLYKIVKQKENKGKLCLSIYKIGNKLNELLDASFVFFPIENFDRDVYRFLDVVNERVVASNQPIYLIDDDFAKNIHEINQIMGNDIDLENERKGKIDIILTNEERRLKHDASD